MLAVLVLTAAAAVVEARPDDEKKQLEAIESTLLGARDTFDRRIEAARLCSALADPAKTAERSDRLALAEKGVAHAEAAIKKSPDRVEGHYFWAICYGRQLENQRLVGPSAPKKIEAAALEAIKRDEKYDHCGPHRLLGSLYAQAPQTVSIGDWEKAQEHFEKAMKLDPAWPENALAYAQELKGKDEKDRARVMAMKAIQLATKKPANAADQADFDRMKKEAEALLAELNKK